MRVRDILEGVGKITSQNATKDVPVGGEYMNVKKLFPKQSKPKLQEFDIKIPDEGDTMGVPRAKMPQIKKQDYQEFLQYLKDNGVDFVQKKMPASSLKATQGEFSKKGVEKQLDKNLDAGGENTKPLIASSDNYIIDGHHRWLAALNTRGSLNVIQANIPGRKLMDLTLKFPKVYFKDIYEGYKIQLERDPNMYVLHIKDSKTGKRTEVRGKSGYESGGYDANDKLHQLLDKIGKSANISELINGETVTINPKHPDAVKAQGAADQAFNEEAKPSKPPKWKRSGPDGEIEIEFPTGRRFKIEKQYDENIRHRGDWKVLAWNNQSNDWEWGDTFSPKGYAKEMVMKMGQFDDQGKQVADYSHTFQFEAAVEENFADGASAKAATDVAYNEDVSVPENVFHMKNRLLKVKKITDALGNRPIMFRSFVYDAEPVAKIIKKVTNDTGRKIKTGSNQKQQEVLQKLGIDNPTFTAMATSKYANIRRDSLEDMEVAGMQNIFIPLGNEMYYSDTIEDLGMGRSKGGRNISLPSDFDVDKAVATYKKGWPPAGFDNEIIVDTTEYYLLNLRSFLLELTSPEIKSQIGRLKSMYDKSYDRKAEENHINDILKDLFKTKITTYSDISRWIESVAVPFVDMLAANRGEPTKNTYTDYDDDDDSWLNSLDDIGKPGFAENFADGKVKGKSRPGRVKRAGASCKGSVTDLRAKAKKYSGERGKMYHWCANMKAGKKK